MYIYSIHIMYIYIYRYVCLESEQQRHPSKANIRPNDRLGMPGKLCSCGICSDCIPTLQRHHVVVSVQDHLSRSRDGDGVVELGGPAWIWDFHMNRFRNWSIMEYVWNMYGICEVNGNIVWWQDSYLTLPRFIVWNWERNKCLPAIWAWHQTTWSSVMEEWVIWRKMAKRTHLPLVCKGFPVWVRINEDNPQSTR